MSSILHNGLYQQILTVIGTITVVGYSAYTISKHEEKKSKKIDQMKSIAMKDYQEFLICNPQLQESNENLQHPSKLTVSKECCDLYNKYAKSYDLYMKNKYNIMSKYMI
jgi:hypothetical protein